MKKLTNLLGAAVLAATSTGAIAQDVVEKGKDYSSTQIVEEIVEGSTPGTDYEVPTRDRKPLSITYNGMLKSGHHFGNGLNYTEIDNAEFEPVQQNMLTVSNGTCTGSLFTSSWEDNLLNQLEVLFHCGYNVSDNFRVDVGVDRLTREESSIKDVTQYELIGTYTGDNGWGASLFLASNNVIGYESIEIRPTLTKSLSVLDRPVNLAVTASYNTEGGIWDSGMNSVGASVATPFKLGERTTFTPKFVYSKGIRDGFTDIKGLELTLTHQLQQ